jgi:hypothetical protein
MRVPTNYGEINFTENKIEVGPNIFSIILGIMFIIDFFLFILFQIFNPLFVTPPIRIPLEVWLIVVVLLVVGLRSLSPFGSKVVMNSADKSIRVIKNKFYFPQEIKKFNFEQISYVEWGDKSFKDMQDQRQKFTTVKLRTIANEVIGIAGFSHRTTSKSHLAGKDAALKIAKFIGCTTRNFN